MNLIERLRKPVKYGPVGAQEERDEAADEIERLSAENSQLREVLALAKTIIAIEGGDPLRGLEHDYQQFWSLFSRLDNEPIDRCRCFAPQQKELGSDICAKCGKTTALVSGSPEPK